MKNYISNKLAKLGYQIVIFTNVLNEISKAQAEKLLFYAGEYHDQKLRIKNRWYMVEITCVDNEVDFNALPLSEYKNKY